MSAAATAATAATATAPARQPSSCQVCFQPGHCYRTCSDPVIEASHLQGVEMFKQLMMSHNDVFRQANVTMWAINLSRGMMRVLLARYTPPELLSDFESIQAWRAWRAGARSSDQIFIPTRPAIQGLASKNELRDMLDVVYTKLANEIIIADIDSMEIIAANDHVAQMRRAFIQLSRNLRNSNLTGHGVQNYAQDAIDYLQVIIQQQEARAVFTPIPVPVMREEYLNYPLQPMVHIPMPRPVIVRVETQVLEETRAWSRRLEMAPMWGEMEEQPGFVPLQPRGRAIPRQNQRQPTFTIDLRLSVPVAAAADATAEQEPIQCGICWDELNDERRIITNCNHNYCDGCITSQLDAVRAKYRRSGDICRYLDLSCALCRQNVHTLSHNMSDDAKIRCVKNVLYNGSDAQIDVAL